MSFFRRFFRKPQPRRPTAPVSSPIALEILESRWNPTGAFWSEDTLALPGSPTSVLAGDFNGDGQADVAAIAGSAIALSFGNGKGQFFPPRVVSLPWPVFDLAVGDFNGDGRADLISLAWQSNTALVSIQASDGSFAPPITLETGAQPNSAVTGDFNGDGKLDLAVANYTDDSLSLLLGNGNGTFRATTRLSAASQPFQLTAGDFNGDGKTDLAYFSNGSGNLIWQPGVGNGTFGTMREINLEETPVGIAAWDLQGDKRTDLLVVYQQSATGSVVVFSADANPTLTPFVLGSQVGEIRVGDLNGDGKADFYGPSLQSPAITVGWGQGNGAFSDPLSIPLSQSANSIAAADFNKDGKIDLAAGISEQGKLQLLSGLGGGAFGLGAAFSLGGKPQSWVGADFNRDGLPDTVTWFDSPILTVLLEGPNRAHGTARILNLGTPISQAIVGDYNSDGNPDLVVASTTSNQVGLLFGNGNGTFQQPQWLATGPGPILADPVDFHRDGKLDLLVGNQDASVLFFPGLGGGVLGSPTSWKTTLAPQAMKIADLNKDGFADLVLGSLSGSSIEILSGTAQGGLGNTTTIHHGAKVGSLTIADFNGDGRLDIATSQPGEAALRIQRQNAAGGFDSAVAVPLSDPASEAIFVDFNGDGAPDLAFLTPQVPGVAIRLNDKAGGFGNAFWFATGDNPVGLGSRDANGDGVADLTVLNGADGKLRTLVGNGDGTFRATSLVRVGPQPQSIVVADFNRDGKLDWAVANSAGKSVSLGLGLGNGTFQTPSLLKTGVQPLSLAAADFNRDGKVDIATANAGDFSLSIHLGNGDGSFQPFSSLSLSRRPTALVAADFNKDGKSDLAWTSGEGNLLEVSLGLGDGSFANPVVVPLSGVPRGLTVGDFNRDGHLDLAIALYEEGKVGVILGKGNGAFHNPSWVSLGSQPWSIVPGDFNGDGKLDLASADINQNQVTILNGQGNGSFVVGSRFRTGPQPVAIQAGDFNRDGRLDLATSHFYQGSISVLTGLGSKGFAAPTLHTTGGQPLALALGDFHGDKSIDLVSADQASGTVSILTNTPPHLGLSVAGKAEYGSGLTLTARLNLGSTQFVPNGSVTFRKGNTVLGTRAIQVVAGVASATLNLPGGLAVGTHTDLVATYAADTNRSWSLPGRATIVIAPKTLSLTGAATDRSYDGTTNASVRVSLGGVVGKDAVKVVFASASFAEKNAGKAITVRVSGIELTGAAAANYRIPASLELKANISPRPLVVSADNKTKVYGEPVPPLTATWAGFVPGEGPELVSGWKLTTVALASSKVGAYAIAATGGSSPNYQISSRAGTLSVTKAQLVLTPENKTKVYGSPMPTLTIQAQGLVNGDTIAAIGGLKWSTAATAKSKVGDYTIALSGGVSPNYTIRHGTGTLKIVKAPLTIAAENKTKVYGQALPPLTLKFSGLVNGDKASAFASIKLSTTALAKSGVGDYPITIAPTSHPNYEITLAPGTLSVTPAPLVIAAENKSVVSGQPLPVLTAKITGLVNGDTQAVVTGLLLSTPAQADSAAGRYTITPSGALAANYSIRFVEGTLTIQQAPAFANPDNAVFTRGKVNRFTLSASGFPAATFRLVQGALPAGVAFHAATGVLSGNPTGPRGTFVLVFTATNGVGLSATQTFRLTIS